MLKVVLVAALDLGQDHVVAAPSRPEHISAQPDVWAGVGEQLPQAWLRAYGTACSPGFGLRKIS